MLLKLKLIAANSPVKKLITMLLIAAILVSSMTLMGVAANSSYTVTIHEAAAETRVVTRKTAPTEILEQANFMMGKKDKIDTSKFVEGEDSQITVYRACDIRVVERGNSKTITGLKTVGDSLQKNLIILRPDDFISVKVSEPVYDGMTVTIKRAFSVWIKADGKTLRLKIAAGTVADAIEKSGIAFDKDDETIPSLETKVIKGMKIQVVRVEHIQRTEKKTIAYESKVKLTDDLGAGQSKLVTAGTNGLKTIVYKDKYIDDVLEKTTKVSEKVTKTPVDRVILTGGKSAAKKITFASGLSPISDLTPPSNFKVDANGLPVNYKRIIEGPATAYSGGGTTATGRPAMEGYVAVDPREIPYGTKLYVVSLDGKYVYGYCIAADTGGFIYWEHGATIDLYIDSESDCNQFGFRGVRIYVLD